MSITIPLGQSRTWHLPPSPASGCCPGTSLSLMPYQPCCPAGLISPASLAAPLVLLACHTGSLLWLSGCSLLGHLLGLILTSYWSCLVTCIWLPGLALLHSYFWDLPCLAVLP